MSVLALQSERVPHHPSAVPLLPGVQHPAELVPAGEDPLRGKEALQARQLPQTLHRVRRVSSLDTFDFVYPGVTYPF